MPLKLNELKIKGLIEGIIAKYMGIYFDLLLV